MYVISLISVKILLLTPENLKILKLSDFWLTHF